MLTFRSGTGKSPRTLPNGEVVWFPRGYRQEIALQLVEPQTSLLDVGCGRGAIAAALSERFDEVFGVDMDQEALDVATSRGVEVVRVDLDSEPLPFPEARFDSVVCLDVIEHVRDPDGLSREFARVLMPGGRLYMSTPNIRFVRYLASLALQGRFPRTSHDDASGWQGGHVSFFTFRDLEDLLRASGFDETRRHGIPERPAPLREFLSVGIFVVARRGEGGVPPSPVIKKQARAS